ncbi:MAG: hypothetical protein LC119_12920 [Burkholderiales bacterium]|nr:hypothetical protein [Burkholderiales bacterium]
MITIVRSACATRIEPALKVEVVLDPRQAAGNTLLVIHAFGDSCITFFGL